MPATFGLDFGTTNSLISFVGQDPETGRNDARALTVDDRPHPSVVWYSGDGPVVGRRAKDQLSELGLGVFGEVVRSPKMFLGSPIGVTVGGVTMAAADVVSEVLRFLREDALRRGFRGNDFESAVVTVPVSMRGQARAELREAASRAGIRIRQFVHEPLAALYGYLRGRDDFLQARAALEQRIVLVFDWGGGTLDLTLCSLSHGVLTQIANMGDTEVGGDKFDLRIRQLVRQRHEGMYPKLDWSRCQPSAEARLVQQCEDAKIALSDREKTSLYVRDILATSGPERNLQLELSRSEVEEAVDDLIRAGLQRVRALLDLAGVPRGSVEFCLATGGMVSMPAIQQGLREVFGVGGLHVVDNATTIIAEGAAWVAHDDIRLRLAKPVELLHATDTFVDVVPTGVELPVDGTVIQRRMDMYCVDPTDGFAKFLFARPVWPGRSAHGDPRIPYEHVTVPVDRNAKPLIERLHVDVSIDQDLIATIHAYSQASGLAQKTQIHDLEFGLDMGGAINAS